MNIVQKYRKSTGNLKEDIYSICLYKGDKYYKEVSPYQGTLKIDINGSIKISVDSFEKQYDLTQGMYIVIYYVNNCYCELYMNKIFYGIKFCNDKEYRSFRDTMYALPNRSTTTYDSVNSVEIHEYKDSDKMNRFHVRYYETDRHIHRTYRSILFPIKYSEQFEAYISSGGNYRLLVSCYNYDSTTEDYLDREGVLLIGIFDDPCKKDDTSKSSKLDRFKIPNTQLRIDSTMFSNVMAYLHSKNMNQYSEDFMEELIQYLKRSNYMSIYL